MDNIIEFNTWTGMHTPIPVLILTGYLGAGKTTLLNHLLRLPVIKDRRIALLINEFGPLGIDGKLIDSGPHRVFELNRGSVFCICTKTDFIKTLDTIAWEVKPDLVIIEATGVADPCDLDQLLSEPRLAAVYKPWANVCLVDAPSFTKVAAFLRTAIRQVQWADGLVINKTDLVSRNDLVILNEILNAYNAHATRVEVTFGQLNEQFLHNLQRRVRFGSVSELPPDGLVAISLSTEKQVVISRLTEVITRLNGHLLRLKGNVCPHDGEPVYVEVVNGLITWKPHVQRLNKTAFTAIGWRISKEELNDAFNTCLSSEELPQLND